MKRPLKARRSTRKVPGRKASTVERVDSTKAERGKQESASSLREQLNRQSVELTEARAHETAVADVLKVISRSPDALQPVLDVIVDTSRQLCSAETALVFLLRGGKFHVAAESGTERRDPDSIDFVRATPIAIDQRGFAITRAAREKRTVHIPNSHADPESGPGSPFGLGKPRALLSVPLMRDDQVIGGITLVKSHLTATQFTPRQIEAIETFADQAVIAISNVNLFEEVQARTRELTESLAQQTATSQVLQVISSSVGELEPVFTAMLESATRICDAPHGTIYLRQGDVATIAAQFGPMQSTPIGEHIPLESGWVAGRTILDAQTVHVRDLTSSDDFPRGREIALRLGHRATLGVPLLRDGGAIGAFLLRRPEPVEFTPKQIELVTNFASQAVIAIENARLLKELRERTDQVAELNRGLEARVAEQVEELGRVGRLKRFLAPQLAELIVSQGDERILESHRREIVVVFCDLRGYTAFTETAEPEEVLGFLRAYHGALGPLVSQFEGTLDQFSGDGIMVFFNDPVPIPDPAERAVKMAVAMREAASTLIAAWRERGRELGFGVGIAQGYATLGQIGFSERSGYTAIGTVCNVASRLCGAAKDGQILVSQHVSVMLKGSVATEQVGALDLKGLSHPVVAYNVPLTVGQPALRVIDGGNH